MTTLRETIQLARPHLAKSSVQTYHSILSNLYHKVFPEDKEIDTEKFGDTKKILDFLQGISPEKRKTTLSALYILSKNPAYKEHMMSDIQKYNEKVEEGEPNESQQKEWKSPEELQKMFEKYRNTANLLYKKEALSANDLQEIQNYILICLYGGFFIPPRRSTDYCEPFRIKNIDKQKDNYLDKNTLHFNTFKTAKFNDPEQKTVTVPPQLGLTLKKWIAHNPTEYLFFDKRGNPLNNTKMNQRLNLIFGKGISVNALRKFYLTNKYGEYNQMKEDISKDMKSMGSSIAQTDHYILKK